MEILLHNYVSIGDFKKYYENRPLRKVHTYLNDNLYRILARNCKHEYQRLLLQMTYQDLIRKCNKSYTYLNKSHEERVKDEYREFIDESKYGRIEFAARPLPLPRVRIATSDRNSFKYAPRRFPNGVGK